MLLKLWELRGMQNVFIQIWNEAKVQIQNLYKSQMRLDMWIIKICTSRRCYEGFGTSAASRPVQRQSCSPLNSHKFSLKQLLLSAGVMIKILFQNPIYPRAMSILCLYHKQQCSHLQTSTEPLCLWAAAQCTAQTLRPANKCFCSGRGFAPRLFGGLCHIFSGTKAEKCPFLLYLLTTIF